jgi:hypothetical protein
MSAFLARARAREGVVGAERARHDGQVPHARVFGEHDGDGSARAASPASLVEDGCDRLGGEGAASQRLAESELHLGGSVLVEQPKEPMGGAAQVSAVDGDGSEKRLSARAVFHQAISTAMVVSASLVVGETFEVGWGLDLPAAFPAALVGGDELIAVEYPHLGVGGSEGQWFSHKRVGIE